MTIDTCYKRLELAKKYNNSEEIKIWEARIILKGGVIAPKEVPKEEVKPRGKTKKR